MSATFSSKGIVCFTYDDRNFTGWLHAIPLFARYHAHATFFVSGEMDKEALTTMETLQKAGHTIGLHTLHHADAPDYFDTCGADAYYEKEIAPQLSLCEKAGLQIHSFVYPNNLRTEGTDAALGQYFRHFRAGIRGAQEEEIFVPVDKLAKTRDTYRVMHGFGIGTYYNTVQEELTEKLHRAAETNTCVTFFSHNIAPAAEHIHMPVELLEHCLAECERCGILAAGFDEL